MISFRPRRSNMALSQVKFAIRNKQTPFYANLLKDARPFTLTATTKEQINNSTWRFV